MQSQIVFSQRQGSYRRRGKSKAEALACVGVLRRAKLKLSIVKSFGKQTSVDCLQGEHSRRSERQETFVEVSSTKLVKIGMEEGQRKQGSATAPAACCARELLWRQ
eukprot:4912040-Pleurochrysis_carterae.AAC.1